MSRRHRKRGRSLREQVEHSEGLVQIETAKVTPELRNAEEAGGFIALPTLHVETGEPCVLLLAIPREGGGRSLVAPMSTEVALQLIDQIRAAIVAAERSAPQ